jgi:hypothetical protein
VQTQRVMSAIGDYMGVVCYAMVGGNHVANDKEKLRDGVHVVIGTPGRILHLLSQRYLGTETYASKTYQSYRIYSKLSRNKTSYISNYVFKKKFFNFSFFRLVFH